MNLVAEFPRRKVFIVGAAYRVVAWLEVQAASIGFQAFDAFPGASRIFILVSLLGFSGAVSPFANRGSKADSLGLQLAWGRMDPAQTSLPAAAERAPAVIADDIVLMPWATRQSDVDDTAVPRILACMPDTDPLACMAIVPTVVKS